MHVPPVYSDPNRRIFDPFVTDGFWKENLTKIPCFFRSKTEYATVLEIFRKKFRVVLDGCYVYYTITTDINNIEFFPASGSLKSNVCDRRQLYNVRICIRMMKFCWNSIICGDANYSIISFKRFGFFSYKTKENNIRNTIIPILYETITSIVCNYFCFKFKTY